MGVGLGCYCVPVGTGICTCTHIVNARSRQSTLHDFLGEVQAQYKRYQGLCTVTFEPESWVKLLVRIRESIEIVYITIVFVSVLVSFVLAVLSWLMLPGRLPGVVLSMHSNSLKLQCLGHYGKCRRQYNYVQKWRDAADTCKQQGACGVCAYRALVSPLHIRKGYSSCSVYLSVCACVSVTKLAATYRISLNSSRP